MVIAIIAAGSETHNARHGSRSPDGAPVCSDCTCSPHIVLLIEAHSSSLLYPKSHSFSTGVSDRSISKVFSSLISLLAIPICSSRTLLLAMCVQHNFRRCYSGEKTLSPKALIA